MSGTGRRKAELELIYARVIKVCKSDPDITRRQIIQRFGIGADKAIELQKEAKGLGAIKI